MRKVISYSFFRHEDSAYESERCGVARGRFFLGFLPALLRAHFSVWPDWDMVIHHDDRVIDYPYFKVLDKLATGTESTVSIAYTGVSKRLCESMLMRMAPIWTYQSSGRGEADIVLCRDIDSLPQPRERWAVEEWLAGMGEIHSLHDSVSHQGTSILGGMCGFRAKAVRLRYTWEQWSKEIHAFDLSKHGSDQKFLAKMFPEDTWTIRHHFTKDMGPVGSGDERNNCGGGARCIGGAYHAGPVAEWYDKNRPNDTAIVREAEKAAGI